MVILRTGTGGWWRDLRQFEWVRLLLVMYQGTCRGIEYFWPAKKRSVTRTDWDKRRRYTEPSCIGNQGERARGGGEGMDEECSSSREVRSESVPVVLYLPTCAPVLGPAPMRHHHHHKSYRTWYNHTSSPHISHAHPHYCTPTSRKKSNHSQSNHSSAVNHQPTAHGRSRPCYTVRSTNPTELENWRAEELRHLVSATRAAPIPACQSLSVTLSVSGRPSEILTVAVAPCRPTALWENSILPIQNPIFATELLC